MRFPAETLTPIIPHNRETTEVRLVSDAPLTIEPEQRR
jgi:hypothetical protein